MPPMHCPIPVAMAAPATPHRKPAINSASRTMFAMPAAVVTARPRFGFSAAAKNVWNTFCSMKAVLNSRTIRP